MSVRALLGSWGGLHAPLRSATGNGAPPQLAMGSGAPPQNCDLIRFPATLQEAAWRQGA